MCILFIKQMNTEIVNGGSDLTVKNDSMNMSVTNDVAESKIKNKIFDDGRNKQNYVFGGKEPSEEAKQLLPEIIKYCEKYNTISPATNSEKEVTRTVRALGGDITYDKLMKAFNATTFDNLLAYILVGYMSGEVTDPMKLFTYTYGRTPPLKDAQEWLDNFRINNLGQPLNMLVWHKYDLPTTFSVHREEPEPINENVEINYVKAYKLLVTPLRGIILNKEQNIDFNDCKAMCDACYNKYAYCYCGAHGCDVFDYDIMSMSIPEIKKVLERYPSWTIGYVLNTATYKSHNGIHWVALILNKNSAKLICSQASGFECFKDDNKLIQSLPENGFTLENNNTVVQFDNFNCGVFSPMSLWALLEYDGDLVKAVHEGIGKNGSRIHGLSHFANDINQIRTNMYMKTSN